MTLGQLLIKGWTWYPEIILGCMFLASAYLILVRFEVNRRTVYFLIGVLVLFFALVSPLDILSDDYLFSAHMLQHLLLVLVVAPLLLLGLPPDRLKQLLDWKPAARAESILGHPFLAWIIGIGTLYLWHLPIMYNAALKSENIHLLQHLSFLVSATIFWWPVVLPLKEKRRLSSLSSMLYIFAGAVANAVLGIILTFAPVGMYPEYLHPHDTLGILPLIRDGWGLDPQSDQQLGGLLMWIPGGLAYLAAILIVFAHWFSQPDEEWILSNTE
jgi:putative membrane protein